MNNKTLFNITRDLRNYLGGISDLVYIISKNIAAYLAKQEAISIKPDANLKEISECMEMLTPYSNNKIIQRFKLQLMSSKNTTTSP